MSWYYAENNERRGPINDAAFDSLVTAGTVRPETLVWKEGMANWQSLSASGYRRQNASMPANMPPVPGDAGGEESVRRPGVEMGVCSESGRILPRSELVEIDGRLVSVEYKNVVLQRIREGVGASGSSVDPEALAQQIIARDYRLSLGSALGRGWQLLKKNFWLCVAASFLSQLVIGASIFTIIGIFFVFAPLKAGVSWVMLKLLRNEPTAVSDTFAGFSRSFWHLVVVGLISFVAILGCFVPAIICFAMSFAPSPKNPSIPMMGMAGLLVFVASLAYIYLLVSWVFSLLLVIDKGIEAWPAMRLSRQVVSMHWWRIFGMLFLLGLMIIGATITVQILCPLLLIFLMGMRPGDPGAAGIQMCFWLLNMCVSMCLSPLIYATIAAMYEDIFGAHMGRQEADMGRQEAYTGPQ